MKAFKQNLEKLIREKGERENEIIPCGHLHGSPKDPDRMTKKAIVGNAHIESPWKMCIEHLLD